MQSRVLLKNFILFIIGGLIYSGLEIFIRGRTHWSMIVVGGICFLWIGWINEGKCVDIPMVRQMLYGAFIITLIELYSGVLLNILLKWNVWDYSNMPFNLAGQICLPFSILWFFVAGIAIVLDDVLRWKLFDEEKPHYTLFGRRKKRK